MWINDERVANIENFDAGLYPKKCPVCGEISIHLLMYKPKEKSTTGGFWIWCSSCKRYSHASIEIPKWWNNYKELEESQLFASPEYYIDNKREEIDKWTNKLIGEKSDDSEESPKTVNDDRNFYVIRIDSQKIVSEEQAKLMEQVCRCNKDEALRVIEREGFKLHPMPAIDTGVVKKVLEAKNIKFSVTPEYKWN